jgi:subtilase family serine protease
VTNTVPYGYTPVQIRHAYGFDQVSFATSNGTVQGTGAGQTIAIVDGYNDPNIVADLSVFDSQFGLAAPPSLKVVNESGSSKLPGTDAGWAMEISLDVEWAHAVAPGANILLVEANSSSLNDLLTAVNYARQQPGVTTVSMSWATNEFFGETAYDNYFTTPSGHVGVTFLAATGDNGGNAGWPAVSPNVVAVGGTTLTLTSSNTRSSETAWSDSSGGVSRYESEPSYQASVQSTGKRTTPDVAYDADPNTGFAVYDSVTYDRQSGWFCVGGTSAGAPQWAGLIAIADQGRALTGLGSLSSTDAAIYALPSSDFYDVTSGRNRSSRATTGYDEVTGLGAPLANLIIQNLVYGNGTPTSTSAAPTTSNMGTMPNPFGFGSGRYGPGMGNSDVVAAAPVNSSTSTPTATPALNSSSADLAVQDVRTGRWNLLAAADPQDAGGQFSPLGHHARRSRGGDSLSAAWTEAADSYFAELADPGFALTESGLPLLI